MSATMVLGGYPLFDLFGLKLGRVTIFRGEGAQVELEKQILTLDILKWFLEEGQKLELLCSAEAAVIQEIGVSIGLLPTWADVVKVVQAFKLPDGYMSVLSFKPCSTCSNPLPHGQLEVVGHGAGAIYTVQDLMGAFDFMMNTGCSQFDLAHAFKQAIEADLSLDDADLNVRYQALSEEQKLAMMPQ